jgi:hypothetical protein
MALLPPGKGGRKILEKNKVYFFRVNLIMVNALFNTLIGFFDPLCFWWGKKRTQRIITGTLVFSFFVALAIIEFNRLGLLPDFFHGRIPTRHYQAINIAFSFVLALEVVSLIFTLPCSVSKSLGKQFEILALILIRSSFKEFSALPEPIAFTGQLHILWRILADGGGAIVIFALLGLYNRLLENSQETLPPGLVRDRFVAAKKSVALSLLVIFAGMALYGGWLLVSEGRFFHFFQHFYTVLIFSDILLVLIAQCFLPEFRGVFRNSGYALSTLLIRLSLAAPAFYNVVIGIASAVFAVALTLVYNYFYSRKAATEELSCK